LPTAKHAHETAHLPPFSDCGLESSFACGSDLLGGHHAPLRLAVCSFGLVVTFALLSTCATKMPDARPSHRSDRDRVVWVAAHPDDEIFAAPLLGRLCVVERRPCEFLVFTQGERGVCRSVGCGDLAGMRGGELLRSAAMFHATVVQWKLADGAAVAPDDVIAKWVNKPGRVGLVEAIADEIRDAAIVLTFNAHHGTSMHPDHRAVGLLVQAAVATVSGGPALYAIENRANVTRGGSDIHFLPYRGQAGFSVRGRQHQLVSLEADWSFAEAVGRVHETQFDEQALNVLDETPIAARVIVAARLDRSMDRSQ
jgi:LmbE family N-acetylglucosaminyl deacetylase